MAKPDLASDSETDMKPLSATDLHLHPSLRTFKKTFSK